VPGIVAVVEDPFIRKLLKDLLSRHGYQVVEYSSSRAVALLSARSEQVNLIITNAPAEFLPFAQWLPVLYLAAAPDTDLASRFTRCRCVRKPFLAEDLLNAVADLAAPVS
jgi:DNA-binding NarL/FixJ family response regulator